MKKLLVILGIVLVLGLLWGAESGYTRKAVIISSKNNIVTAKDESGNIWHYNGDGAIGEEIELIMDDNHTSKITDDIVKGIK